MAWRRVDARKMDIGRNRDCGGCSLGPEQGWGMSMSGSGGKRVGAETSGGEGARAEQRVPGPWPRGCCRHQALARKGSAVGTSEAGPPWHEGEGTGRAGSSGQGRGGGVSLGVSFSEGRFQDKAGTMVIQPPPPRPSSRQGGERKPHQLTRTGKQDSKKGPDFS